MGDPGYIGTSYISFSGLRSAWGEASYVGGSDPGSGSNSNISLSEFRGATFTNDTSVPDDSDEEISIEDDFKNKPFGSVDCVTNTVEIMYHRYGSTFANTWTPLNHSFVIPAGTFIVYFWNSSTDALTKLDRITGSQTQASSVASYSTLTVSITQPADTSGYLLMLLYGFNSYTADMGLGKITQKHDDGTVKQYLYRESDNATTAKSSVDWENTDRVWQNADPDEIEATSVLGLEDEIATDSVSGTWYNILTYTSEGTWQQDINGTPSGSTGPIYTSNGAAGYYIFCETSGGASNANYWAALRCPITIAAPS